MEELHVIRKVSKGAKSKKKISYVKQKMESSDLLSSMGAIMEHNTLYYRSDFEIDKEILKEATGSPVKADRTLLWISRTHGTHCFRERDVFMKNSHAYHTWLYYADQVHENVLAYVVESTGKFDGKPIGSLYHLDYKMHCTHVEGAAIPVGYVKIVYEHGERIVSAGHCVSVQEDSQMGKVLHVEEQPKDPGVLESILQEERTRRELLRPVSVREHLSVLEKMLDI